MPDAVALIVTASDCVPANFCAFEVATPVMKPPLEVQPCTPLSKLYCAVSPPPVPAVGVADTWLELALDPALFLAATT